MSEENHLHIKQTFEDSISVKNKITARIQESHITAGHAMLQYIEDKLLNIGWLTKD
jgi:hypothetical protein